jgi:hypothetical protein
MFTIADQDQGRRWDRLVGHALAPTSTGSKEKAARASLGADGSISTSMRAYMPLTFCS